MSGIVFAAVKQWGWGEEVNSKGTYLPASSKFRKFHNILDISKDSSMFKRTSGDTDKF